jgi:hypothetical protein
VESKLTPATEAARLLDADAPNYKRVAEAQRIRLADHCPVAAPRTHAEYARTRCYSSDVSNAAKFGTDVKGIADEVRPARCASGMRLTIGFGCDAIATRRFDTSKIRIVWRNASTPKFNNAEFEER